MRDLVRAREEIKADRRIARQRIRSFLLRYGKRYPKPNDRWSFRFEVWMRALRFEEPAAQAAFEHLLGAYFVRDSQLGAVDAQIEELALARTARARRGASSRLPGHRHALGGDDLNRDVRLPAVPLGRCLHGLHGADALGALEWCLQAPGFDHQDRQLPRAPRTR